MNNNPGVNTTSPIVKTISDPNPKFFFLSPKVKIITVCRISMWGWNRKINLWPRAVLCFLQRISWLKLETLSPAPGAADSSVFPLWSFLICQNTFLLNLCSRFNVYSMLNPYADFFFFFFALQGRPHREPICTVFTKIMWELVLVTTKQKWNVVLIISIIFRVCKSWDFL